MEIDKVPTNEDLAEDIDYFNNIFTEYMPRHLRMIDVLLVFPEFETAVSKIRKNNNITPEKTYKSLNLFLGSKDFKLFKAFQDEMSLFDENMEREIPSIYECLEVNKRVKHWEHKNLAKVNNSITDIRLRLFGKLPFSFHEPIKDYVVYGIKNPKPINFKMEQPVSSIEFDSNKSEPYIIIKIYGDTDISSKSDFIQKQLKDIRKLQKSLPTYYKPIDSYSNDALFRTWLYLFLTEFKKLTPDQANLVLSRNSLSPIDQAHITLVTKTRFLATFKRA